MKILTLRHFYHRLIKSSYLFIRFKQNKKTLQIIYLHNFNSSYLNQILSINSKLFISIYLHYTNNIILFICQAHNIANFLFLTATLSLYRQIYANGANEHRQCMQLIPIKGYKKYQNSNKVMIGEIYFIFLNNGPNIQHIFLIENFFSSNWKCQRVEKMEKQILSLVWEYKSDICLQLQKFQHTQIVSRRKMLEERNKNIDESFEFEDLKRVDPSKLFTIIKKIFNSGENSQFSVDQLPTGKFTIPHIFHFIIKKIEGRTKLQPKQFVGYFSMLTYIKITLPSKSSQYKCRDHFYHCISSYSREFLISWIRCTDVGIKNILNLNLSTLLCSFSSLIKLHYQHNLDFSIEKILQPKLLRTILTLKLPNEQKFMKHYKILICYISRIKNIQFLKLSFIQSLSYHLITCNINKSTQIMTVYILNTIIKDINFGNKKQYILNMSQRCTILQSLLKMLSEADSSSQVKLILELYGKILGKDLSQLPIFTTKYQIQKTLSHIYTKNNFENKLHPYLKLTLTKIPQAQIFSYFEEICLKTDILNIDIEIMQVCTRIINQSNLIKIIQLGYWNRIMNLFHQQNDQNQGRKYMIYKIVENIISNFEINKDLQDILNSLIMYSQILTYLKAKNY